MRLAPAFAAALSATGWPLPLRDSIIIALVDVADWAVFAHDAAALLDDDESARVHRQRRAIERDTRTIAYALHRLLVGAALGRDPRDVPLLRDALGSPRLGDGALHVSLSHADGRVALAIADGHRVGVDIEPTARAPSMLEIAGHVCHPDEAHALETLPQATRASALLALWVRKEALLKAAGVGLGREMSGFSASAGVVHALEAGDVADTVIRMVDAGPGWCAAVAGGVGATVYAGPLRPV